MIEDIGKVTYSSIRNAFNAFYQKPSGREGDFALACKNPFLEHLLQSFDGQNWVDIESEYYKQLLTYIGRPEKVAQFQGFFDDIKKEFVIFLTRIKLSNLGSYYQDQLGDFVKDNESLLILNFNYTKIINATELLRLNQLRSGSNTVTMLNIHGDISFSDTLFSPYQHDIVFGYGDETHSHFTELENLNDNVYMENIKSFSYGLNLNYSKLVSFIESNTYEVEIWGHSCGLSDRTLLSYLFEHDNCEKIKIRMYSETDGNLSKDNNYIETYQNISRHFSDKTSMRKKVEPYGHKCYMWQVNQ